MDGCDSWERPGRLQSSGTCPTEKISLCNGPLVHRDPASSANVTDESKKHAMSIFINITLYKERITAVRDLSVVTFLTTVSQK